MPTQGPKTEENIVYYRSHRWKRVLKSIWIVGQVLIVLLIMSILFAGGVAAGFFASHIQDEPHLSYDRLHDYFTSIDQTGAAYFRDGELIGELRTDYQLYPVTVDEVSPHMINALLATEDNEYYTHDGINPKGLSRAIVEEILTPGQGTGGSTITQQLVKNQIVGPERTLDRKFREIALAVRADRLFDKNEILEAYLNVIYLGYNANGTNIAGIQAAAEGIFDIDASDLNVAQSAYIAGMIQSPGRYTPFNRNSSVNTENLERGVERAEWVLERMLRTERITEDEYEEALGFNFEESLASPKASMLDDYPYLTYSIEDRASSILEKKIMEEEGKSRDDFAEGELEQLARRELARGGYKVYTTVDRELYEAFHNVVDEYDFGPRSREKTFTFEDPETGKEKQLGFLEQAGATFIDNETGAILAMVEGRDFEESQIDFTRRPFQPGSSIKPVIDFGPAMEEGLLQPASVIDDTPLFDYGDRPPRNFLGDFRGLISVRDSLIISQNIPAIKAYRDTREEIGTDGLYEYAQRLGLTHITEQEIAYDSTAIGGLTRGWTVEQATAALATFAGGGLYREPYLIERIESMDGEVIFEQDVEPDPVFSAETAFLINDMLRDVVTEADGTAHFVHQQLHHLDLDIAGKTGTTNEHKEYWFVGYTPQISLGLWMGYQERDRLDAGYSQRLQHLWVQLLKTASEVNPEYTAPGETFHKPETIVEQAVCSKSGKKLTKLCRQAGYVTTDYFHPDHVPLERDDTVVRQKTVVVDGRRYTAQDSTPDDLVQKGKVFIKREPLNIPDEYRNERWKWLPADWDDTAALQEDPREDNGRTPGAPDNVTLQGSTVTWSSVNEDDIAGYRIYRKDEHVGSVPAHETYQYSLSGGGEVHVTAVDIAGRESDPGKATRQRVTEENEQNQAEKEPPAKPAQEAATEPEPEPQTGPEPETQAESEPEPNTEPAAKAEPETSESDSDAAQGVPSAPQGVSISGGRNGITLTWGGNPAQEQVNMYSVYVSTGDGFKRLGNSSETSFSHVPQASVRYEFYITATNASGESGPSSTVQLDLSGQ